MREGFRERATAGHREEMQKYPAPHEVREVHDIGGGARVRVLPHRRLDKGERCMLVEPETGAWIVVERQLVQALDCLAVVTTVDNCWASMVRVPGAIRTRNECVSVLCELYNHGLLEVDGRRYFDPGYYECYKALTPNLLVLNVTTACNLRCSYCYTPPTEGAGTLDVPLVEKAVDEMVALSGGRVTTLCFHGGEPLLQKGKIRDIVARLEHHRRAGRVEYVLQTNATLLDAQFLQFAREHAIEISVSLDGPPALNDLLRVTPSGAGTYGSIRKGVDLLVASGYEGVSALAVVTSRNQDRLLDVVLHLQEVGVRNLSFSFFTPWGRGLGRQDLAPSPEAIVRSYKEILRAIVDGRVRDLFVQTLAFYICNVVSFERPYMCMRSPCGAGLSCLGMDEKGSIYACDCGIGCEQFLLGNIANNRLEDILRSPANTKFRERTVATLTECKDCLFAGLCCGTCPSQAYAYNGDVASVSPIECHVNKAMFEHVLWCLAEGPELLDYFLSSPRYASYFRQGPSVA